MEELTIAICTRNRRSSLLETLDSLTDQTWRGSWEVLVIDNGSTDGTSEAVRSRSAALKVPLRIVREPEHGLSHARNRALEDGRGRAIVFIDDDVTCLPGWVAAHGETFREDSVVGTGGPIMPLLPTNAPEWIRSILTSEVGGPTSRYEFGDEPRVILPGGPIPPPFGANMGMLRDKARSEGGFRIDLGWGKKMIPSEEVDLFRRLQKIEGILRYVPGAALFHRIEIERLTRRYWNNWQQAYGRSTVIMNPPGGIRHLVADVAGGCRGLVRTSLIVHRGRRTNNFRQEMDGCRDRERYKGRLLQLLGL